MSKTTRLTDQAYVEMVCSLFLTKLHTTIMGLSFIAVGGLAVLETGDLPLGVLLVLGSLAAAMRLGTLIHYSAEKRSAFDAARAGRAERRFATPYFAFALIFGLFAARAFTIVPADIQLLVVGLLFGYGAGVAAAISLRPWICIPAALLAIVPTILVTFLADGGRDWKLGLLTSLFLAGGIETMLRHYRATAERLTYAHLLSMVGRRDDLTGLANQLTLREHFTTKGAVPPGQSAMIATYVVAVDGLAEINTDLGHPTGDDLLKAMAERIGRLTRAGDIAARLSGASFAIVQSGLDHPRVAQGFAQELHAALSAPYVVEGGRLTVTIHIGYVVGLQRGANIDLILPVALRAAATAGAQGQAIVLAHRTDW